MNNDLFLLGGYDLEMLEIKSLLDLYNIKYIDKKLSWGAKLSDYKDKLDFNGTIYGIELYEDITPPNNYIAIDHHGQNDYKPSSLEQIAEILNLKLTRKQKLIAANDSRYISGMKALCATQEEINKIRKHDRQMQGITQVDEQKAKESLENSTSNIIYSITPYFSAISDMAYYKYDNYIIYNDTKINFYGYKKDHILSFLDAQNIKETNYYFGGGEFGFVGIKDKVLNKQELETLIKEFKKVEKEKTQTISHHIFMLPFKYKDKKSVIKNWKEPLNKTIDYNQQAYFHKFFINSMFKNCEIYERKDFKTFKMKKSKEYTLEVEKLSLRIFEDFKVGILSFHLDNKQYKDTQNILEINDYSRRIYPEYLDDENKCSLVPEFIKLDDIKELFNEKKGDNSPKISNIITSLVGDIQPAVDDRMFTISYFNNPKFSNGVKENYLCNDKWYEYIFVDGDGKCVQDKDMQVELIKKATYSRWKDYETMYGMSRYSFVCLANSDFPLSHMKTMYFSMFSLLLMIRATLLKFADDVSDVAKDIDKDVSTQVNGLYKDYIKFINKYYFREITAKDQGIELYERALDILKIQRDIKDLDREIEELFKYIELKNDKKSSESLNFISYVGGALLPASIVTSFLGMNYLDGLGKYLPELLINNKGVTSTILVFLSIVIIPAYLILKKREDI